MTSIKFDINYYENDPKEYIYLMYSCWITLLFVIRDMKLEKKYKINVKEILEKVTLNLNKKELDGIINIEQVKSDPLMNKFYKFMSYVLADNKYKEMCKYINSNNYIIDLFLYTISYYDIFINLVEKIIENINRAEDLDVKLKFLTSLIYKPISWKKSITYNHITYDLHIWLYWFKFDNVRKINKYKNGNNYFYVTTMMDMDQRDIHAIQLSIDDIYFLIQNNHNDINYVKCDSDFKVKDIDNVFSRYIDDINNEYDGIKKEFLVIEKEYDILINKDKILDDFFMEHVETFSKKINDILIDMNEIIKKEDFNTYLSKTNLDVDICNLYKLHENLATSVYEIVENIFQYTNLSILEKKDIDYIYAINNTTKSLTNPDIEYFTHTSDFFRDFIDKRLTIFELSDSLYNLIKNSKMLWKNDKSMELASEMFDIISAYSKYINLCLSLFYNLYLFCDLLNQNDFKLDNLFFIDYCSNMGSYFWDTVIKNIFHYKLVAVSNDKNVSAETIISLIK